MNNVATTIEQETQDLTKLGSDLQQQISQRYDDVIAEVTRQRDVMMTEVKGHVENGTRIRKVS